MKTFSPIRPPILNNFGTKNTLFPLSKRLNFRFINDNYFMNTFRKFPRQAGCWFISFGTIFLFFSSIAVDFASSASAENYNSFPKSVRAVTVRKDVYTHQQVRTGLFQSTGGILEKLERVPFNQMRKDLQCSPHEPELDMETGSY